MFSHSRNRNEMRRGLSLYLRNRPKLASSCETKNEDAQGSAAQVAIERFQASTATARSTNALAFSISLSQSSENKPKTFH